MPDLHFTAEGVSAMPYTAAPTLSVRLQITNSMPAETIQSVLLNCQLQLRPLGRAYSDMEEARLLDLFGERERWGQTMKPLHWMNVVLKVRPFTGSTTTELPLPCSLDFDVAAHKYFYGLEAGSITVAVMFSGTVFYADEHGNMQIAQIPWDRETQFQLPVAVWQAAVDAHYAGFAWLRLPRDTFDRLYRYKTARGIPMWDDVLTQLLEQAEFTFAGRSAP